MELESGLSDRSGLRPPRSLAKVASIALALCLAVGLSSVTTSCASDNGGASDSREAAEDGSGRLEPRYQPREPLPEPFYDNSYLFGMTRGVTGSTIHPAAQMPLLILTIPLDIVFLPFAAIAGFF